MLPTAPGLYALFLAVMWWSTSALAEPNIVYINVDDLGWADVGYQGSRFYETPNIDRLATEGMVFSQAYAPAANCAPSRACCLTGQYTPRHGVYTVNNSDRGNSKHRKLIPIKNTLHIDDDNVTIAGALKDAGYATCTIGKWHVSEDPTRNGFDVNVAGFRAGHPPHGYFTPYRNPKLEDGPEGEYLTDRLTDEAIAFIRAHKNEPFFLYLPYYTVHSPLQGKQEKIRHFRQKEGDKERGQTSAVYAAMIASLDDNVGRLLESLDEMELTDNTLVLFTSDNGGVWKTSRQWPLRAGKGSYYEGGIREPLIVRWPGKVKTGSACDVPVSGVDFFPTFLDAASADPPLQKVLDGVSLLPLLTGDGTPEERPLYWHFPIYLQGGNKETQDPRFRTRPGSAVRLGDWKLIEYFEDGTLELYNLEEDPSEKKNLAPQNLDQRDRLHDMLVDWRKHTKAPVPTELNPKYGAQP